MVQTITNYTSNLPKMMSFLLRRKGWNISTYQNRDETGNWRNIENKVNDPDNSKPVGSLKYNNIKYLLEPGEKGKQERINLDGKLYDRGTILLERWYVTFSSLGKSSSGGQETSTKVIKVIPYYDFLKIVGEILGYGVSRKNLKAVAANQIG
ncbi:hypothetical protein KY366_07185 [Candidatus Woesearchaeota archaeon]|nr:hypothetical protein [Candidatus Woesearchaeota archaeon]